MPFSMNGNMLIGNLSNLNLSHIWIANGFGPYGIMYGPMSTKLLADKMILNKDRVD